MTIPTRLSAALLAAPLLALGAAVAEAGPPAVCHPLATRGEVPIPAGPDGWGDVARGLSGDQALEIALDALAQSDETLLHMETLRRAVIAITGVGPRENVSEREQHRLAARLVSGLAKRVERTAESCEGATLCTAQDDAAHRTARRDHGRARFDLAYAAAALSQVGVETDVEVSKELARALADCDTDGAMYLGAALALWKDDEDALYRRLGAALERSKGDPVLEKNLASAGAHFLECRTLAELRDHVKKELGKRC